MISVTEHHRQRCAETIGKPLTIYHTDGGCSGNNQLNPLRRRMVAVVTTPAGKVLVDKSMNGGSNNVAELWAVVEACEHAITAGVPYLRIVTDSKNNLSWTTPKPIGADGAKSLTYPMTSALKARFHALERLLHVSFEWVPRDKNAAGHYIEERYAL